MLGKWFALGGLAMMMSACWEGRTAPKPPVPAAGLEKSPALPSAACTGLAALDIDDTIKGAADAPALFEYLREKGMCVVVLTAATARPTEVPGWLQSLGKPAPKFGTDYCLETASAKGQAMRWWADQIWGEGKHDDKCKLLFDDAPDNQAKARAEGYCAFQPSSPLPASSYPGCAPLPNPVNADDPSCRNEGGKFCRFAGFKHAVDLCMAYKSGAGVVAPGLDSATGLVPRSGLGNTCSSGSYGVVGTTPGNPPTGGGGNRVWCGADASQTNITCADITYGNCAKVIAPTEATAGKPDACICVDPGARDGQPCATRGVTQWCAVSESSENSPPFKLKTFARDQPAMQGKYSREAPCTLAPKARKAP